MLGHVWYVCMLVWLHKCEPGGGGMCVSREYSDTQPWAEHKHQSLGHHYQLVYPSCGHCQHGNKACWNPQKSQGVGASLEMYLAFSAAMNSHRFWPPTGQGLSHRQASMVQTLSTYLQWGDEDSFGHLNSTQCTSAVQNVSCVYSHVDLLRKE